MVYVAINEKKANEKALLKFLKKIDKNNNFVNFMGMEKELKYAICTTMKTPRVKFGNSLREILLTNGI